MSKNTDTLAGGGVAGDLRLVGVTKRFGAFKAVDDLSLTIPQGSFFALLGASGCGKTTTLRMVSGWRSPAPAGSTSARRTSPTCVRTSGRSTPSSRTTRCSRT